MRQTRWTDGGGRSRRQFLRQSAGGLAALATTASGGCLSFLPPASRTIRYGDIDVPTRGSDDPVYRRWFPAASELPALSETDDDDGGYGNWTYVTPGALGAEQFGRPFDIGRGVVQATMDYVGYPLDAYDRLVGVDSIGSVAEASIDRETVRATLSATNYERTADYRGYDVYDRTDVNRLVAVSDGAIIHTDGEHRRAKAAVLADAGAGRIDRRHEVDETFAAYTDHVGAPPTVLDAFGLLDGATESGLAFTFDDASAYFVHDHAFPAGETPARSEVKRQISGITRGRRATRVDVTVEDPFVRVALQLDESVYMGSDDEERYRSLPFVTWGVDDGPDTITVSHDAGDPVLVDRLDVRPDDALSNPPAAGSTLEPGDELAFATADLTDDEIRFVYRQSENSTSLLFHYDTENASTT